MHAKDQQESDETKEEQPEKPHRWRPPHIVEAMERGDRAMLSVCGQKGNASPVRARKNARKSKLTAQRKAVARMLKAQRKKDEPQRKAILARLAHLLMNEAERREDEVAVEIDVLIWGLRKRQARRQALKDARAHEEANLAGCSHD